MIVRFYRKLGSRLRLLVVSLLANRSGVFRHGDSISIEPLVRIAATDGGSIEFGDEIVVRRFSEIVAKRGGLTVGSKTFVGLGATIVCQKSISIGANCLFAEYVTIRDQDHVIGKDGAASLKTFTSSPVVVGDNVWLGAKVTVTQGVTIGNNVVVGANSVVTHDLPDNCVAVGAPARVVRQLKAD